MSAQTIRPKHAGKAVRVVLAAVLALVLPSSFASAHLCNDVFAQAKDNLAVKVDIRDGQLRIARDATFRVYLLNTMDRDIANIALTVLCNEFDATVKPSADWRGFPVLKTVASGGRKECFEVTLTRKPGVKDGRYKIELHLFNGRDPKMTFKTIELGATADEIEIPRARGITINGTAGSSEWKKALLISDFYSYEKNDRFFENVRAADQPRYRLAYDDEALYALFSVRKQSSGEDTATMYVATGPDATPVSITFNLRTGEAKADFDTIEVLCRLAGSGDSLECRIPRKLLGLDKEGLTGFFANFTRSATLPAGPRGEPTLVTSYWRGNRHSAANPVVYAHLLFATE